MVAAVWNGVTIAQSDETILLEGNHYFPRSSVRAEYLVESTKSSLCPWKGLAKYYSLSVDGAVNADAAWHYPKPTAAAAGILDHIAFWRGVRIV